MRWTLPPRAWRALLIVWMTTIFVLSAQSSLPTPSLFAGQDKLEHFLAYGLLGILVSRSLQPMRVETWRRVMLITALVTLYGISDEYHQSFVPGRNVSALDVLADGVGGFLAARVLFWWDSSRAEILRFSPSPSGGEGRGEG